MISRHQELGIKAFFRRTIAAQIHFIAFVASVFGTIILAEKCLNHSPTSHVVAVVIFGLTSIFLFATSSIYHFLYDGFQMSKPLETRFEKLDHIAIFLFISGTYTALLMNTVAASGANTLLGIIWSLAFLGIIYTFFRPRLPNWAQHRYAYTAFYLLMGWVFVIRIREIVHVLDTVSMRFLLYGGLSYSVGALIYAFRWPNPIKNIFGFHELWHLLVLLGYGFHFLLISGLY